MKEKIDKKLWGLVFLIIIFSIIFTSYKTLVEKDFIILEQEEITL